MNWETKSDESFLSRSVAYSTRMRKSTLYRSFSALFIFFRMALEEGIEIFSHYRAAKRLVFRVALIQKGQKWKITVAILHSEWGLYLASCYSLYFYIFTGKCSLYCLQSVKPIHANDKEIFCYIPLYLISYFTANFVLLIDDMPNIHLLFLVLNK